MQEVSSLKNTQYSSSLSQLKQEVISQFDRSFEENLKNNLKEKNENLSHSQTTARTKTLKEQENRCIEIASNKKIKEKMCVKVEEYLSRKILEERRRIKVMIQVINDICKNYPYFLFYGSFDKKKGIT